MLRIFDYMFFRIFSFSREKGDKVSETNGYLIVSLFQFLMFLDLYIVFSEATNIGLPKSKYYFLPSIILIGLLNWYRYEKQVNIDSLVETFKNEPLKSKKKRGVLIVFAFSIVVLLPVLYGMKSNNQF